MNIVYPIKKTPYLKEFSTVLDLEKFDNLIKKLDKELINYEKTIVYPLIEENLISKNGLLTSFAISKAEDSKLTLAEAKSVYKFVLNNKEYKFISNKIEEGKKLTQKDYEKLEFYNISKVFNKFKNANLQIKDLNLDFIKNLHLELTAGLDIFEEKVHEFEPYYSGILRKNNKIKVGNYSPISCKEIELNIQKLISWFKSNPSVINVSIFHSVLYAIHPFNNGNKRTCRILEYILIQSLGLNKNNLYSTSYYYHLRKDSYYKNLLNTIKNKNLNYFTMFYVEAFLNAIFGVYKTSLEFKRSKFIGDKDVRLLKLLVKEKAIRYRKLKKLTRHMFSETTLANKLGTYVKEGVLKKTAKATYTFYSLNINLTEEDNLDKLKTLFKKHNIYIPDSYLVV